MTTDTPALLGQVSLKGVSRHYGTFVAVDDVSMDIAPGEFISFLGPSGSGKTTTLMMVAGFEIPDRGAITLDGKDITRLPAHRRELGIIFQNYALFPHMTVAENVAYPLRMRRAGRSAIAERVARMLDLVQLAPFADRYPSQLSGGQQQRVAIARALVFDPPVLLLDEPLGALDKKLRQHLQEEIRFLHRRMGKTMIYVTHDQDEALAMSDRIAVMSAGRVHQLAAPEEIYRHPTDRFVASFMGESNFIRVTRADGGFRNAQGQPVPVAAGADTAGDPVVFVRPENIRIEPPEGAGGPGRLDGRIEDLTYVGDSSMLSVGIGSERLSVKVLNRSGSTAWQIGDRCRVFWDPDDALLLPDG
ncbi:ABC transporter ATP-binding protein [Salipiger sp. P9]|uniref:ABC transporter ATP-binding protein n=1 Tax=Salipiger pentaromativorans TaxID=2943193 RepID=UPI002157D9D6|nr:ABC transporter ATP-binding protein [Salipiger pentaromativorans]MCR8548154.1 ABC transporter ATP-binding protein [Salipiger pentaromativorans]